MALGILSRWLRSNRQGINLEIKRGGRNDQVKIVNVKDREVFKERQSSKTCERVSVCFESESKGACMR